MTHNQRRIRETNTWPKGLWDEVTHRFVCPTCQAKPGDSCLTSGGNLVSPHGPRKAAASLAIVEALDAGRDPKAVSLPGEDINQALDLLAQAEKALWKGFGLENPLPYNVVDKRKAHWRRIGDEFGWWDDDSEWQDALAEADNDPDETDAMYSGEVYGTSVWQTETHTVAVLNDGCGNRDAYVFLNTNAV